MIDNKEFKSVKNMIVQTVMKLELPIIDLNAEIPEDTGENGASEVNSDTKNSVENKSFEIKIQPLNSAEQQEINNSDTTEKIKAEILANTVLSLFINLSCCIEDDYHNKFKSGRKMIDSKLRRMIQEKNQALGIKQEHGQTQEY